MPFSALAEGAEHELRATTTGGRGEDEARSEERESGRFRHRLNRWWNIVRRKAREAGVVVPHVRVEDVTEVVGLEELQVRRESAASRHAEMQRQRDVAATVRSVDNEL